MTTSDLTATSLEQFNRLPADEARAAITVCLAVPRWVGEVVAGRPYDDLAGLVAQAAASAQNLSDDELDAALARHPRIGQRRLDGGGAEAALSRAEQSAVDDSDQDIVRRLHDGNVAYEKAFGRVFLIRAAGRSSAEILVELERRLGNDSAHERREVVAQLREIALLRLEQLVER